MKNDNDSITRHDIPVALALLTRLPVRVADHAFDRGARAAWAYPLVGVVTGGIAALVASVALWIGINVAVAAFLAIATQTILTGAMHEDGLADTADGLWGGWDRETRLKIMKDSHIGSYGVLVLILSVGVKWAALSEIMQTQSPAPVLLAAAILSRATMVHVMQSLPQARPEGLSARTGRPGQWTVWTATGIGLAAALLLCGLGGLLASFAAALATLGVALLARVKIGGQTGDILGATQQLTEITVLLTLLARA